MADPLVQSLQMLIRQSAETFGPDDAATLMLQQQLAALLEEREKSRKVFWIQPAQPGAPGDGRKP